MIKYRLGALRYDALDLLERKGLYKYEFTEYSKIRKLVDSLNNHFKGQWFRTVIVESEGK